MTTPHTITITHTLTEAFLRDIMTTAVESSYEWFNFEKVERVQGGDRDLSITSFEAIEVDCDGDGSEMSRTSIDAAKVTEALQKMLAGGITHQANVATLVEACTYSDASHIDADLADCIMQVACFGELRYG